MPEDLPRDLGTLVASRMGSEVLRRLVTPIAGGIHAADPHLLSVDVVSPGLRGRRPGHRIASSGSCAVPLTDASGACSRVGSRWHVHHAGRTASSGRTGRRDDHDPSRSSRANPPRRSVASGDRWYLPQSGSIFAPRHRRRDSFLPDPSGSSWPVQLDLPQKLLSNVIDTVGPELAPGAPIGHVNLALQAPALDSSPRGNGMLVAPGTTTVTAKALTHMSAKWPSLRESCPEGLHLLRVFLWSIW